MSTNLYLDARLFKGLSVPKPPEVDDDITQQESPHVTQLFAEGSTGGQGASGTRGGNPTVKAPSPSGEQRDYYDPIKVKVKKSGDSLPNLSHVSSMVSDLSKFMKKSLEGLDKGMMPPKTDSTTPAGSGTGPAAAGPAATPPPAGDSGPPMGMDVPPAAGGTTPPPAAGPAATPPAAAGGTTPPAAAGPAATPPPISEHPVQPQTPESHPPNMGPVGHIPHTDGTHTQVHAQDHKLHFTHVDQNGKNTVSHPPMAINDATHVNPNDRGGYHLTVPSKLADKTEHTEVPLHADFDKAGATGGRHHVSHDVVSPGVGGADHLQEIQGHLNEGKSVIVPAGEGGDKHGVHQHIEDTLSAGGDLGFDVHHFPNNDLHLAPKKGAKGEGAPETEEAKPATPVGVEPGKAETETPEPEVETKTDAPKTKTDLQHTDETGSLTVDGWAYEGSHQNGQAEGKGKFNHPDGHVMEGEFKDGKPHGQAEITIADGRKKVGEFKDGELHNGTHTEADGTTTEFRNGKPVEAPKRPESAPEKESQPEVPEVETPEPEVETTEPEVETETPEPETRSISEIEAELRDKHDFTPEDLKDLAAHVGNPDHEPHAEAPETSDGSWGTHSTGHATFEEATAAANVARLEDVYGPRNVSPEEEARLKEASEKPIPYDDPTIARQPVTGRPGQRGEGSWTRSRKNIETKIRRRDDGTFDVKSREEAKEVPEESQQHRDILGGTLRDLDSLTESNQQTRQVPPEPEAPPEEEVGTVTEHSDGEIVPAGEAEEAAPEEIKSASDLENELKDLGISEEDLLTIYNENVPSGLPSRGSRYTIPDDDERLSPENAADYHQALRDEIEKRKGEAPEAEAAPEGRDERGLTPVSEMSVSELKDEMRSRSDGSGPTNDAAVQIGIRHAIGNSTDEEYEAELRDFVESQRAKEAEAAPEEGVAPDDPEAEAEAAADDWNPFDDPEAGAEAAATEDEEPEDPRDFQDMSHEELAEKVIADENVPQDIKDTLREMPPSDANWDSKFEFIEKMMQNLAKHHEKNRNKVDWYALGKAMMAQDPFTALENWYGAFKQTMGNLGQGFREHNERSKLKDSLRETMGMNVPDVVRNKTRDILEGEKPPWWSTETRSADGTLSGLHGDTLRTAGSTDWWNKDVHEGFHKRYEELVGDYEKDKEKAANSKNPEASQAAIDHAYAHTFDGIMRETRILNNAENGAFHPHTTAAEEDHENFHKVLAANVGGTEFADKEKFFGLVDAARNLSSEHLNELTSILNQTQDRSPEERQAAIEISMAKLGHLEEVNEEARQLAGAPKQWGTGEQYPQPERYAGPRTSPFLDELEAIGDESTTLSEDYEKLAATRDDLKESVDAAAQDAQAQHEANQSAEDEVTGATGEEGAPEEGVEEAATEEIAPTFGEDLNDPQEGDASLSFDHTLKPEHNVGRGYRDHNGDGHYIRSKHVDKEGTVSYLVERINPNYLPGSPDSKSQNKFLHENQSAEKLHRNMASEGEYKPSQVLWHGDHATNDRHADDSYNAELADIKKRTGSPESYEAATREQRIKSGAHGEEKKYGAKQNQDQYDKKASGGTRAKPANPKENVGTGYVDGNGNEFYIKDWFFGKDGEKDFYKIESISKDLRTNKEDSVEVDVVDRRLRQGDYQGKALAWHDAHAGRHPDGHVSKEELKRVDSAKKALHQERFGQEDEKAVAARATPEAEEAAPQAEDPLQGGPPVAPAAVDDAPGPAPEVDESAPEEQEVADADPVEAAAEETETEVTPEGAEETAVAAEEIPGEEEVEAEEVTDDIADAAPLAGDEADPEVEDAEVSEEVAQEAAPEAEVESDVEEVETPDVEEAAEEVETPDVEEAAEEVETPEGDFDHGEHITIEDKKIADLAEGHEHGIAISESAWRAGDQFVKDGLKAIRDKHAEAGTTAPNWVRHSDIKGSLDKVVRNASDAAAEGKDLDSFLRGKSWKTGMTPITANRRRGDNKITKDDAAAANNFMRNAVRKVFDEATNYRVNNDVLGARKLHPDTREHKAVYAAHQDVRDRRTEHIYNQLEGHVGGDLTESQKKALQYISTDLAHSVSGPFSQEDVAKKLDSILERSPDRVLPVPSKEFKTSKESMSQSWKEPTWKTHIKNAETAIGELEEALTGIKEVGDLSRNLGSTTDYADKAHSKILAKIDELKEDVETSKKEAVNAKEKDAQVEIDREGAVKKKDEDLQRDYEGGLDKEKLQTHQRELEALNKSPFSKTRIDETRHNESDAYDRARSFASDDPTRMNLNGVFYTPDGKAVASDGSRMAIIPTEEREEAKYRSTHGGGRKGDLEAKPVDKNFLSDLSQDSTPSEEAQNRARWIVDKFLPGTVLSDEHPNTVKEIFELVNSKGPKGGAGGIKREDVHRLYEEGKIRDSGFGGDARDFPDYTKVIPDNFQGSHTFEADQLRSLIGLSESHDNQTVSDRTTGERKASKRTPYIHLAVDDDGKLHALASHQQDEKVVYPQGHATAKDNDYQKRIQEGEDNNPVMSFDKKYLKEALDGAEGRVTIEHSGFGSPLSIRREDGEHHIVMPVRSDSTASVREHLASSLGKPVGSSPKTQEDPQPEEVAEEAEVEEVPTPGGEEVAEETAEVETPTEDVTEAEVAEWSPAEKPTARTLGSINETLGEASPYGGVEDASKWEHHTNAEEQHKFTSPDGGVTVTGKGRKYTVSGHGEESTATSMKAALTAAKTLQDKMNVQGDDDVVKGTASESDFEEVDNVLGDMGCPQPEEGSD